MTELLQTWYASRPVPSLASSRMAAKYSFGALSYPECLLVQGHLWPADPLQGQRRLWRQRQAAELQRKERLQPRGDFRAGAAQAGG